MIRSFGDRRTRQLFRDEGVRRHAIVQREARRLLLLLDAARDLDDVQAALGPALLASAERNHAHEIVVGHDRRILLRSRDGDIREVELLDRA